MSLWDLIYSQDEKPADVVRVVEKEIKIPEGTDAFTSSFDSDCESSAPSENDQSISSTSGVDSEAQLFNQLHSSKHILYSYRDKPVVGANAKALKIYSSSPEFQYLTEENIKSSTDYLRYASSLRYAPGFSTSLLFPQCDISCMAALDKSLVLTLWDTLYFSGDIPGAFMVLESMTDLHSLDLADLIRVLEMTRTVHAIQSQTESPKLSKMIEKLMSEAFKDNTKMLQTAHATTRNFLLSAFTELLLIEGETDYALELLKSRTGDAVFMNSPIHLISYCVTMCIRSTIFVNKTFSAMPSLRGRKDTIQYTKVPTLNTISQDLFQFSIIVKILSSPTVYLPQSNTQFQDESKRHLKELKSAFASAIRQDGAESLSFCELYLAFMLGLGLMTEAISFIRRLRKKYMKKTAQYTTNYKSLLCAKLILKCHARLQLKNIQCVNSLHGHDSSILKLNRLSQLFNLYLKHEQRESTPFNLYCTVLLFKLKAVPAARVIIECCQIIETSSSTCLINRLPTKSTSMSPKSTSLELESKIEIDESKQYMNSRAWHLLASALGPLRRTQRDDERIHVESDIHFIQSMNATSYSSYAVNTQPQVNRSNSSSEANVNTSSTSSSSSSGSSSISSGSSSSSSSNSSSSSSSSSGSVAWRQSKEWWLSTILSPAVLGDCVNYTSQYDAHMLMTGTGMRNLEQHHKNVSFIDKFNHCYWTDIMSNIESNDKNLQQSECVLHTTDVASCDSNIQIDENGNNDNDNDNNNDDDDDDDDDDMEEYYDSDDEDGDDDYDWQKHIQTSQSLRYKLHMRVLTVVAQDKSAFASSLIKQFLEAPMFAINNNDNGNDTNNSNNNNSNSNNSNNTSNSNNSNINSNSNNNNNSNINSNSNNNNNSNTVNSNNNNNSNINSNSNSNTNSNSSNNNGFFSTKRFFPAFRTDNWPVDSKYGERWNLHSDWCIFSYLSNQLLELLTYQIIIACHLNLDTYNAPNQDCLFVVRGIQVIMQHAIFESLVPMEKGTTNDSSNNNLHHPERRNMKRKLSCSSIDIDEKSDYNQQRKLDTSVSSFAHQCLHILQLFNINIMRAVGFAYTIANYDCSSSLSDDHHHNHHAFHDVISTADHTGKIYKPA